MVNVRIVYTLAPQWNAHEWLAENISLQKALSLPTKSIQGEISESDWALFSKTISWTEHKDGTFQIRADVVPVKTMVDGAIELYHLDNHRVEAKFAFLENRKTWHALKQYESVLDLLNDLNTQTINDLSHPVVQSVIGPELGSIFSDLYERWLDPNIEDSFSEFALRIGKCLDKYHPQMRRINWLQYGVDGEVFADGGFEWSSQQPLQWEAVRLLYYVTQGFSVIDGHSNLLWVSTPPSVPEYLDVSFLRTRILSLQHTKPQLKTKLLGHHPGEPKLVAGWLSAVRAYAARSYPDLMNEDTLRIVWHVAVIIEYTNMLKGSDTLTWSLNTVYDFIKDRKFREDLLHSFLPIHLNHSTYLDDSIQFWEHGSYLGMGGNDGVASKNAITLCKGYFTWVQAVEKGYSDQATKIYSTSQANAVWHKLRHTEVAKKFEPYFRTLASKGPERFFVRAPDPSVLDVLNSKFPNFVEVTTTLQKHLRLIHLQQIASLSIPTILLIGSPGLGKTRYLYSVVKLLQAPMYEIAMSSISAGFVLAGSDLTWQSAKTGKIADAFLYDECANPIFVLDEIDKVSSDTRYDPYGPLHQLLEKHTAKRFMDEALQLEFDTSFCSWFATANYEDSIPDPILSRFKIFHIPDLTWAQTPMVAQSIYDELLANNGWGSVFSETLSDGVFQALHGMDARAMYNALFDACANASERTDRPLYLMASDIPRGRNSQGMGFM